MRRLEARVRAGSSEMFRENCSGWKITENGGQEMGQEVKEHVSAHLDFRQNTKKPLASYRFSF